jgi:hypothetical protein
MVAGLVLICLAVCITSTSITVLQPEVRARELATSLCAKEEKVVFSCTLKNAKVVSLCSSTKLSKTEGYLQYRFGGSGKIELEYPKEREATQKAFKYSHYFRAQVDLTEISFTIDRYVYTIFDTFNGEEKPAISEEGISVTPTDNKKAVSHICRGRAKVDFTDISETLPNESSP